VTAGSRLDARRRSGIVPAVWPIAAAFIAFVAVWQAIVLAGRLPAFILPGPGEVAARFGLLARLASPYLVAAQAIPILAIAPLLSLWFGTGLLAKVVVCGLIVFFPVAVATMVGIREVDRGLLELARSLRASRRRVLVDVELPAALPVILGGLRVGVTLSVVGAIVGEWAGPDKGLGVLINLARGSLFDTPLLFATLVTIALLGIVAYGLVVLAERRLVGVR
jgi:NitT/TauT family transport system permease protein